MANAIGIGASGAGSGPPVSGVAPDDASGIAVSGFIDPLTYHITLTVEVTPPNPIGDFIGCHLYFEGPDQSADDAMVVGESVLGVAAVGGRWFPLDIGRQVYVASQQPWTVSFPGPPELDPNVDTPCRLYAVSFSTGVEKKLVQANQTDASPNQAFALVSLASGSPTGGTGVTKTSGAIVATVLPEENITGKLVTPVYVIVGTSPADIPGWSSRLVLTFGNADPTKPENQFPIGPIITTAGPVFATGDGVATPHAFVLDTPTAVMHAIVWLQSGLVDGGGNYRWNDIVPGITPEFPITYGTETGTIDARKVMAESIAASMAVVNELFGVAPEGITNDLLGPGSVATINIEALAITHPLLGSLVVEANNLAANSVTAANGAIAALAVVAANLANSSVTATAIANAAVGTAAIAALAVGTAAIQTAAITNALLANAAVSNAKIQSATITGASIASATIAGANIGTATVAQANMANASIGSAQIQNLAVTNAHINDLSASKITAGTISASISISAPTINGGTFAGATLTLNANGVTTTIDNSLVLGTYYAGVQVQNNSTGELAFVDPRGFTLVGPSTTTFGVSSITISGIDAGLLELKTGGTTTVRLDARTPKVSIDGVDVIGPSGVLYGLGAWTAYTPTTGNLSSTTIDAAHTTLPGKTKFVRVHVQGTSNGTNPTFTLPATPKTTGQAFAAWIALGGAVVGANAVITSLSGNGTVTVNLYNNAGLANGSIYDVVFEGVYEPA